MLITEHGPQLVPEAQLRLQRIQEGTQKMGGMIDDLLNLARLDRRSMDLQMTSLNSLVENVLHDLESETTERKSDWRAGVSYPDEVNAIRQTASEKAAQRICFRRVMHLVAVGDYFHQRLNRDLRVLNPDP